MRQPVAAAVEPAYVGRTWSNFFRAPGGRPPLLSGTRIFPRLARRRYTLRRQVKGRAFHLQIGALYGSGTNDVAIACRLGGPDGNGGIAVCVGTSTSTTPSFQEPCYFFQVEPTAPDRRPQPKFVKIAKMNNDALNDLITSNEGSQAISVLINDTLVSIGP